MKNLKQKFPLFSVLLISVAFISGCAGTVKNMQTVTHDTVTTTPDEGKSMVIFMRPSTVGYAIQSSVFEIKESNPDLVGIVAALKKTTYQVEPGKHLFMVVGESADFMSAELEANKTYYAFVTPRMGVWKARFSLKPIHADELNSPELKGCLMDSEDEEKKAAFIKSSPYSVNSCEWVKMSPESEDWAAANMNSIQSKHTKYYKDWMSKDSSKRPLLLPEDGQ